MKDNTVPRRVGKAKLVILRRLGFLEKRVASAAAVGTELSFDKAEAHALRFALECIEVAHNCGLITPMTGHFYD